MPKVGMEPIRRRQLIEATIASIHEEGFGSATIAQISRRAGVSGGIVAHYFHDKAGLLEATMRSLAEDLRRQTVAQLAGARGPEARLEAVIDANFAPALFAGGTVTVWLAFWSQVPKAPGLARIQRVYERRLHSNLLHDLKRLLPAGPARRLALGLAALIDGLWLRAALGDGALDPATARGLARDYLANQLAAGRKACQTNLTNPSKGAKS